FGVFWEHLIGAKNSLDTYTSNCILLPIIKLLPFINRKSPENRCSTKTQEEHVTHEGKGN
ncbi:MAG: hypothetical protein ACYSYL_17200, partial [Planctomycetota bacterium]